MKFMSLSAVSTTPSLRTTTSERPPTTIYYQAMFTCPSPCTEDQDEDGCWYGDCPDPTTTSTPSSTSPTLPTTTHCYREMFTCEPHCEEKEDEDGRWYCDC